MFISEMIRAVGEIVEGFALKNGVDPKDSKIIGESVKLGLYVVSGKVYILIGSKLFENLSQLKDFADSSDTSEWLAQFLDPIQKVSDIISEIV